MKRYPKHIFTYPDLLNKRFNVTKVNKVWTIDDRYFSLKEKSGHLKVLSVLDLATRKVLKFIVTTKDFNANHVSRAIRLLIEAQHVESYDDCENRLIIHTDQDTHYVSKVWYELQLQYKDKIRMSMSAVSQPVSNSCSERFNGTLAHLKVNKLKETFGFNTLEEVLNNIKKDEIGLKELKQIVKIVIDFYNNEHFHRTNNYIPKHAEIIHLAAEPAIGEPEILKTKNGPSGVLEEQISVASYKEQLHEKFVQLQTLKEWQGFDEKEKRYLLAVERILSKQTQKLATLNQAQYVDIKDDLDEIKEALKNLTETKNKKQIKYNSVPLRDPIVKEIYDQLLDQLIFFKNSHAIVNTSQMRIILVVLYVTGARVNEIVDLTYEDFLEIPKKGYINLHQTKVAQFRSVYLGPKAIKEFDRVQDDINYIFKEQGFKLLGATKKNPEKAMEPSSMIRKVNNFLKNFTKKNQISYCIKSHSFRVAFINNILKKSDISKAAALVGHSSLETTKRYLRYENSSLESRNLLDEALFDTNN